MKTIPAYSEEEFNKRRDLTTQALIYLNAYATVHDEALANSYLVFQLKDLSKKLIDLYMRNHSADIARMGKAGDGKSYDIAFEVVLRAAELMGTLPLQKYAELIQYLEALHADDVEKYFPECVEKK